MAMSELKYRLMSAWREGTEALTQGRACRKGTVRKLETVREKGRKAKVGAGEVERRRRRAKRQERRLVR